MSSKSKNYDPYVYLMDGQSELPKHRDVSKDVRTSFDPRKPDKLVALLNSRDDIVVQRALAIFGELGKKAFGILDVALAQAQHPSLYARSHLLDGVLCYTKKLTALQIGAILPLAGDPEDLIRGKMMTILATVERELLKTAVTQLQNCSMKPDHLSGLQFHFDFDSDAQSVFDQSFTASRIKSIYMLASLDRRARNDSGTKIPNYTGDSYLHKWLLFQMRRFLA